MYNLPKTFIQGFITLYVLLIIFVGRKICRVNFVDFRNFRVPVAFIHISEFLELYFKIFVTQTF